MDVLTLFLSDASLVSAWRLLFPDLFIPRQVVTAQLWTVLPTDLTSVPTGIVLKMRILATRFSDVSIVHTFVVTMVSVQEEMFERADRYVLHR